MEINWFTLAWTVLNFALWLLICAIPVAIILLLVSAQKRLARIESAIEELRRTLPPEGQTGSSGLIENGADLVE